MNLCLKLYKPGVMRYAIAYVSTAHIDLQEEELERIMVKANEYNNANEITGILLYNERNFFSTT